MAWSSSTLTIATQLPSTPLFIANNVLRSGSLKWHNSVSTTPPTYDHADVFFPLNNINEGYTHLGSRSYYSSNQTDYVLYMDFSSTAVTFDSIYVTLLYQPTAANSVSFIISNNADLSSPTTLATWSVSSTFRQRFVSLDLNTYKQYTGTGYAALHFNYSSGQSSPPHIGTVQLGQRRVLTRNFESTDYSPDSRSSEIYAWTGRKRNQERYIFADGVADFSGKYSIGGSNDTAALTTIESIFTDCDRGRYPVVFIPDATDLGSISHRAFFGWIPTEISTPRSGPFLREWDFKFAELSPTWEAELRT